MTREERRKLDNADLVRRMRAGEFCSNFSAEQSRYPARPLTRKDPKALRKLYGSKLKAVDNG